MLVTLAVLAVWIYIEVEPVLSQNGNNIFNQIQNNQQTNNWNNNQNYLVPPNYLQQDLRSQNQMSPGMMSFPKGQNAQLPRRDQLMGNESMPRVSPGMMPQQGQMPFMPTNNQPMFSPNPAQIPQNQAPQQTGLRGMFQNMFGQKQQQQAAAQQQAQNFQQNGAQQNAMANQAVGAVRQELTVAANHASQAESYRSDAISIRDKGAKRRAAQEARYYANQAQAAASRAIAKARGVPQAMSLAQQVRAQASRAQSAADSASSYASGW